MSSRHIVHKGADAIFSPALTGFAHWSCIDETTPGAVHTGFAICRLGPGEPGGTFVASYEQGVFLVAGEAVLQTPDGAALLRPGDYGLVPVGVPHTWRNEGNAPAVWAQMVTPQPRQRHGQDLTEVPPLPATPPAPVDPRDPRTRRYGHISPSHMEVGRQSQDQLALSASMRTALLVYSGITVKMMIDSDLGADLATMFMVHYDPDGVAGPHDHPLEETYYFLEGHAEGTFDGEAYELVPGDVAFAGVGCVHSFRNLGGGPLRWLETQAPQPPGRHAYRFRRDWEYLTTQLEGEQ